MVRTFHSKIDKKTLLLCVLPVAVLFVYFFWNKMAMLALLCAVFQIFVMERLLHTEYVFTDNGCLLIRKGRFVKVRSIAIADIVTAEVVRPSSVALLRNNEAVLLTMTNGKQCFITPFPVTEFCKYLEKKQQECLEEDVK